MSNIISILPGMMICFSIALSLLFFYGILLQLYGRWWAAIPEYDKDEGPALQQPCISVIVPARNEAGNIAACIYSICRQNYPRELFQLIVVDDQSTDDTYRIAAGIVYEGVEKICLRLEEDIHNRAPKKRAIAAGIAIASGSLIVTTDADCIAGENWLQTIARFYAGSGKRFIAAPVKIASGSSLLSRFQALDFLTMQGITGAAVFRRFHNMCNGANLAYEKKVFREVEGFAGIDTIASGDDMLLMNKILAKYPDGAGFVKAADAIITTQPAGSWTAFFRQRIRWASKATHYHQAPIFLVLLLVYLTNLLLLGFLAVGLFNPGVMLLFLVLWVTKFSLEYFFVKEVARFFGQYQLVPWLLILQPLHIIYIVASGFLGQFKSYEWKGRKLR